MAWLNCNADVHVRDNIRHISLIDHSNNFQLLPPEIVQLNFDLTQPENYQFIKQCSEDWFRVRKLARVTGSTLNAALGLDTLQKQKDHHHIFVRGRQPPPIPNDLQQKFDHRTKNEVNAIATLISTIIPAYLPACYAFYEVSPAFVGSEKNETLLEVSADGLVQCLSGYETCPNYQIHSKRKIVVEIKSPTPQENVAETIFYEVPNRYVPQLLVELQAYNCAEVWLLCSMPVSASLIEMKNNSHLWAQLWELCCFLYADEKQNVPTKLHPAVKDLKLAIANKKNRISKFLCEVPTITGEYGNITLHPQFSSPYSYATARVEMNTSSTILSEMSQNLATNTKSAFREYHQVLRDPGKELLVFMLTDKDRKQHKNVPYSFPVAYALKGSCMTNRHLQFMVHKLRNELHGQQIPVLFETYDGQWHKYITESPSGKCLTRMYGREVWNNYSSLSKDKCIEKLNGLSVVKKSTLETIRKMKLNNSQGVLFPGICIEKGIRGDMSAASEQFTMHRLHSIHPSSRFDLFERFEITDPEEIIPEIYAVDSVDEPVKRFKLVSKFTLNNTEGSIAERKQIRKKRVIGLQENEQSILDIVKLKDSPDEDLENANVDVFQAAEETVTLDTFLRNPN